jgi:Virulence factor BrkB
VKLLRVIWKVFRRLVWETATDNTTGLAAQMAYTLLIALAPVLLFLWHLLGLFGTDPAKLHGIFGVLKSFLPPDPKVQDVLDAAAASVVVTGSSGFIANAGILLGIYCGTVFIATISRALSHTYGVTEPRNWWSKYIISFLRNACRNRGSQSSTPHPVTAMGCGIKFAVHRFGAHHPGAPALSADTGELSDCLAGLARCDLFFSGLDHGDEIVSIICRPLQPLRRHLSGAGVDHHFADLDVSHLFVPAARGQTERDPSPRTRKARQIRSAGIGDAAGVIGDVLISLPVDRA